MTTNHFSRIRGVNSKEKGGTLISMIGVMLIVGVLGISVISFTQSSEHSFLSANAGSRAYYLAESGLRYAQPIYCDEGWLHGRERTLSLQGGEQVNVIRIGDNFWATAITDAGTAKQARARVPMPLSLCGDDPDNPPGEFAVFGKVGISLGNNTVIQGDVAISDGNIDIKGDVEGSVLAKDVLMSGPGTITGDIYSSGIVDIRLGSVLGDIHAANGIILSSAQSFAGWLFSNGSIQLGGGAQVLGHVYSCGGNLTLDGGATIGTADDPVEVRISGNVTISGTSKVYGNVYAGGTITGPNKSIVGDAYAGGTISSGTTTGNALQNSPTYVLKPICPDLSDLEDLDLPDATVFTAGGSNVTIPRDSHSILPPGIYGGLSSHNQSSGTLLDLKAGSTNHGNYYFNSLAFGNSMTLRLDLSGTYDIRIFVVGNITLGSSLNVLVSTNGTTYTPMSALTDQMKRDLGSRVYWESHGNFSSASSTNWFGTVYTPVGSLSVGNFSYLIGSFYSGGGHNIQGTVFHVAPNYFATE